MKRSVFKNKKINRSDTTEEAEQIEDESLESTVFIKGHNKKAREEHSLIENLRHNLKALKPYAHTNIGKLDAKASALFSAIVSAAALFRDCSTESDKKTYGSIVEEIKSVYSDVTNIVPGTVASYLMGCMNKSRFFAGLSCDPKCAGSLPDVGSNLSCDDRVMIYEEGRLRPLNHKKTEHSYVYVSDPNFKINEDFMIKARSSGISNVTLIKGNDKGEYNHITSQINVNRELSNKDNAEGDFWNANWTTIICLLVIVLLVIFCISIVLLFR